MAPVIISSTGIPPQTIDSPELISLIERLSTFDPKTNNVNVSHSGSEMDIDKDDAGGDKCGESPPLDIDEFVDELKKYQRWRFQEQADLHQWTHPLNAIDAALNYFLNAYPSLLLVARDKGSDCDNKDAVASDTNNKAEETPQHVISSLEYILTFLASLLRNAINKTVFNSIFELSSLLAASSDSIASLALEALAALATPPMLHRQMTPELASHTTRLHSMTVNSRLARRLMDMARGWGAKGSGLGLLQCINTASVNPDFTDDICDDDKIPSVLDLSFQCHVQGTLVSITLTKEQLLSVDQNSTSLDSDHAKRQKTGIQTKDFRSLASKQQEQQFKSTAQIFQESMARLKDDFVKKSSSDDSNTDFSISPEKQFTLLSTIRLSKSFYQSSASRVFAVKLRLRALITIMYTLSSIESITAYFMAQPELCGEIVDLVRPTVSSSGAATSSDGGVLDTFTSENEKHNPILALADSPQVPYDVRTLAIEALTALVARRDTASGSFSIATRQANVLSELGVGKGQYLGLLPTLIRFSLAALNSFLLQDDANQGMEQQDDTLDDNNGDGSNTGLELGLAFIRATKPSPLPRSIRQERALEFIDTVLTLTSAVISVPSGTSALTDCGIIPALVSTIALDSQMIKNSNNSAFAESNEESYSDSLLKFITAQAIQILEGAIVTHTNALSAFHELKGVDVLVQRLSSEVEKVRKNSASEESDVVMEDVQGKPKDEKPRLQGAQRVLLFSTVNCLTVVFHSQDARAANAAAPPGGTLLRKPELMSVVLDIMDNVESYGGVMAALVATLLSDVMNSDPQSVHYVHSSGLAKSFLSLILGKEYETKSAFGDDVEKWREPILEPSGELIMAIPNVVSALCLTEAGARVVADANPFPQILSVLCSPAYAMPKSRCLLSEMAAIIGSGLDEIMRHNPVLRPNIVKAVIRVMKRVVYIGKNISKQEENANGPNVNTDELEIARTQMMQYGNNITQLLEQLFHNEDYVSSFFNEGGFDVILELARWSIIPTGRQLVAHASCMSNPSVACLTHSRTASSLSLVVRTIARYHDPQKLLQKITSTLSTQLDDLNDSMDALRASTSSLDGKDVGELACDYILDGIPCTPLYNIESSDEATSRIVDALSVFYRSISTVDWLTNTLAIVINAAVHRTHELGLAHRRDGWKKEISSKSFEIIVSRLSALHRSSLWEVCRTRTKPDFDERESTRSHASKESLQYKMRIVCQEGAIVRNGIEIDGCENVGSVEMGEVVEAFDRCINSSGVLRYHTSRGWISELTRGSSRENIVEILDVVKATTPNHVVGSDLHDFERVECSVPDLRSVSATVMTKLHRSHLNLFGSLERLMTSSLRLERSPLSNMNSPSGHVVSVCRVISTNLQKDFQYPHDQKNDKKVAGLDTIFSEDATKCMYFGNIINLLHTCIYEEKRERRIFNTPLILNLLVSCGWKDGISLPEEFAKKLIAESSLSGTSFLSAVKFVLHHSLSDMENFATSTTPQAKDDEINGKSSACKQQRVSRAVASALPPTLTFLKRLVSRSLLIDNQISNALSKFKPTDFASLILDERLFKQLPAELSTSPTFNAGRFARSLHLQMAKMTDEIWLDQRICCAPAHVLNPFTAYTGELMSNLEEAGKPVFSSNEEGSSRRTRSNSADRANRILSSLNALLSQNGDEDNAEPPEPFAASEETIERLSEMGFGRDSAIDALETVESNNVELAMEYLLAHPPSSPGTLERRRTAREQRRNRQQMLRENSGADGRRPSSPLSVPRNEGDDDILPTGDEEKSKSKTDAGEDTEKDIEEKSAMEAKEYANKMRKGFVKICLDIIEDSNDSSKYPGAVDSSEYLAGNKIGEGDSEGVTVIISNFLLTMCKRSDEVASTIALDLLRRLKENIVIKSKEQCEVRDGCETKFAAVTHASVILMRAMPKLRPLLLREGVVICLLHCVRNVTTSPALRDGKSQMIWPSWLAPTLLLLEVMAQPTSVSLDAFNEEKDSDDNKKKGEFAKVLSEHKKQSSLLAKGTKQLISSLQKDTDPKKKKDKKSKQSNGDQHDGEGTASIQIPPFFPLILYEHAEQCMIMCLQLLGLRTKKSQSSEQVSPPPGIVNAILALLIRVVHSHKTATLCLQMGGADLIVALPDRCHFPESSSLVTLLLRRLLEDEATLQTMMETEIRSQVTKISRKNNPRSVNIPGQPKAPLKSFMKAVAPIICRDPMVFVKAISTSVNIEPSSQGSSSLMSSRDSQVVLLSPEQRIKNSKLLGFHANVAVDTLESSTSNASKKPGSQEELQKRGRGRSKSPHRKNKLIQLNGSPASHISSLLLREVFRKQPENEKMSSSTSTLKQPFLSTADYLDILSDLVLAIPACGAAIHRYKPSKSDHFNHALSGCADPAQNTVSFLLHKLIPQPRVDPRQHNDDDESSKRRAYSQTRISQSAARLIVCLVARSGEGRRRVIADMMFALSGGRCPFENRSVSTSSDQVAEQRDKNIECWALQSWGELCISLSAPRFNNSVIDVDSKMLSFDVVKLMLECGGAHSLVYAIERIDLNHAMAQTVASSLVKPLEILTRGAVYKTVTEMTEKEKLKAKEYRETRRTTFGPSHRCESAFADDAMLEDGFDADTAINARRSLLEEDGSMDDDSNESDVDDSMDDEDLDEELEVRLGGVDYSDESEIEESDDDDNSDDGEESDDDDDDSDGDEDMEDDTENEDEIDEMDDEVFLEGGEEEFAIDDENDFFGGYTEDDVDEMGDGRVAGADADADDAIDGWTRIDAIGGDASGVGGIPQHMARALGLGIGGNGNRLRQQGAGGLLGAAAESILGNILRAGDVGMDSLAEIEDTLGIRFSVREDERNGRGSVTGPRSDIPTRNTFGVAVNQSLPPDAGNTQSARDITNTNPMDYIFGGPAVVLGSQSYDVGSDPGNSRRNQTPSVYDTDLFPGGLAASAHSRTTPRLHPLVGGLELPPLNSLIVIQRGRDSDHQGLDGTNRANNLLAATNAPSNIPLVGWTDDGMPPDSSTEEFISSIGHGLTTMFSRDISRSDNSNQNDEENETSARHASSADPDGGDDDNDEDVDAPDDDENVEEAGDNDTSQAMQLETAGAASMDSGENVASSLAAGLNISQTTSAQPSSNNNQDVETEDANTNAERTSERSEENADGHDDVQMAPQEQNEVGDLDASGETVDAEEVNQPSTEPSPGTEEEEEEASATGESSPDAGEDNQRNPDNSSEVEAGAASNASNAELSCPPDVDPEVFASLPLEMQQEVIAQHNAMNEVAAQIPGSSLDPEALAALPEEMRREIIEEERQQQRLREREAAEPAADPANAEEIDPASFLASLTPELRQDILLTAEDTFLQGLPQNIQAEANALRERVVASHQRRRDEANAAPPGAGSRARTSAAANDGQVAPSRARRQRNGKLRVETDKEEIIYTPESVKEGLGPLLTAKSAKVLLNLLYLVSPLQPQRVVHKLLLNLCLHAESRGIFLYSLTALLNNDRECIEEILNKANGNNRDDDGLDFPPLTLLGTSPDLTENMSRHSSHMSRRRNGENMLFTISSSLPASARGSCGNQTIPPVVARRIISMLTALSKSSPRIAFSMLAASAEQEPSEGIGGDCNAFSCLERLLDLLEVNLYSKSATNLEQLLSLLEIVASPLSLLPKEEDQEVAISQTPSSPGKEWVKVPRVIVSEKRLHLLINTLRLESCKESSFVKVNALTRRLSRVEANRDYILRELASVAQCLGADAIRDLRSVSVRLSSAAKLHQKKLEIGNSAGASDEKPNNDVVVGTPSSAVSLSIGSSEVKLLRVLQTLNSLCIEFAHDENAKNDGYSAEFASLCQSIDLESLWDQLSLCLRMVSVLEGVTNFSALDDNDEDNNEEDIDNEDLTGESGKKLQNSVAGLITRFLPAIEAFFMVNASSLETPDTAESEEIDTESNRLVQFVAGNKVLLNALLRSNQNLLEKGLKAMVKMPNCRPFLDFDVKRQWFKTQVRRLRQQANRRHGSLRLNLRRKHVFEDSFHAFTHRSAEELRGRLQITFVDEEGVDAGGLSREFFAILAKEMFNPNYALFMSTEDGCTFQPNPNSSINIDHLRYFRFVGRIVGKAVVDGFLLDAHFTRSLYKHMLGVKPTHNDMQAIDPDYYKNLQMILQHNLEDIGLELTFSTEDHSFGRSKTIDLIPNGRNIIVTEERKEEYVNLVCQHRMTTAIEKQIKAYLEGFHDMVDNDLISIFNAKELELLISGMPDIDIDDLKRNTTYNGYRPADREIEWFWNIMFSLSRSEKAAFLQFVTGSAKVPLAGFSELQGMRGVQQFSINKTNGPEGALMSAHTCFNALDLPVYKSEEEMKEKLLFAISEGAGGFLFA